MTPDNQAKIAFLELHGVEVLFIDGKEGDLRLQLPSRPRLLVYSNSYLWEVVFKNPNRRYLPAKIDSKNGEQLDSLSWELIHKFINQE